MKSVLILIFTCVLFVSVMSSKTVYVSTTGLDTNPGTIALPFKTITKALSIGILPGDTILVRGGVYISSTTITLNTTPSGVPDTLCHLYAFPGERAILDFTTQAFGSRALQIKASYWHVRGFDIKGSGDNGINISGSYNTVEFCSTYECKDTGIQLGGGANNNRIINCDSYYNIDPGEGNADGFAPKLDVGTNNYFYGCRAWQNSDDGVDGYLRPSDNITTILDNCWTFMNGFRKNWTVTTGNGNGFKMGGSDTKLLRHDMILYNCLTFDNKAKGFDQNNNKGSMTLINCTGYRNGLSNYSVISALDTGEVLTVTNSLAYGPMGTLYNAVLTTNSWMLPDSVTRFDFLSIDTAGMRGPRKPDGSLPDITFLHLSSGSQLINAGTVVPGRTYFGTAPDLGCFEDTTPPSPTTFQLSVNVTSGWNMVSVPGTHPINMHVDTWWSGRNPLASVYKWTGTYAAVTVTSPREGYWMLHTDPNTYNTGDEWPAGGIQIVAHDPIPVTTGWNMIGGYDGTPLVSALTTTPPGLIVPGTVYGWSGSYSNATNLNPGYGYWVLINAPGGLINIPSSSAKGVLAKEDNKETWGKIILTDASGKSFTLYSVNGEVNLDSYQMPPLPPAGAFDVRYTSGRRAEDLSKASQTIEMTGIQYPVRVSVENTIIRIQDGTAKGLNTILKAGESVSISRSEINKLMVSGNVVPVEYSLGQNYPNPFNPSTLIQFSLPEDVNNVTLTVYDGLGQKVAELVNGSMQAGYHQYQWNASNVASGLYIYQLRTEKFVSTKKMMLLK